MIGPDGFPLQFDAGVPLRQARFGLVFSRCHALNDFDRNIWTSGRADGHRFWLLLRIHGRLLLDLRKFDHILVRHRGLSIVDPLAV